MHAPTCAQVIGALVKVRVECAKVLRMSCFSTHYTKSVRLDEFEQLQTQNTDQVRVRPRQGPPGPR